MKRYWVYILASKSRVLYIGVTSNLILRVSQHKAKEDLLSFTARYNVNRLVYFEEYSDAKSAIAREKQLKGWLHSKKVGLIDSLNPTWRDLSEEF
jgi:putative endonuclease